ncbi:hypothetical protein PSN45_004309 [Yamadazyma tenuis]|uniref:Uncharacterized protein n=1 Tax=Candida tenuis (strain ATCC 10573 / BCRC 21748 / CBS 615 / JCM 9827 / NBRC 10315 / NRRL Y-1498 / VKM Y-70) TaxID=590646 RepID=G3B688_CANTC|nr:uncharacterized protein CANTEDRAFT_114718 [Yamadazyma tenuis ATCC 10573]EGV63413.1 hypothetical protein CANTEDRAFT_114718 [Yamadazyma tenuis ATCC 10573]WEJ96766.1 hypothetical protein PSN45_004309 [Yamadazyma tenuis]
MSKNKMPQLHKRSVSSFSADMRHHSIHEKLDSHDPESLEHRRKNSRIDIVLIVLALFLTGSVINFFLISRSVGSSSLVDHFHKLVGSDPDVGRDTTLESLLGVQSLGNDMNEWERLSGELQSQEQEQDTEDYSHVQHQYGAADVETETVSEGSNNPQQDLVEMLSIDAVVLLLNDENLLKQERAKQILNSLKMTPELKTINLKKHPHYAEIMHYLKKFSSHMQEDAEESDELDTQDVSDSDDIPRLFIGGQPVAGFGDIINKHNDQVLTQFFADVGRGWVKLEI